jgi:hypothetical protein
MITTSPISAQNNPWHGGALNGNEIERFLESVEWVLSTLKSLTTTDEKLSKELFESKKCGTALQIFLLAFVQQDCWK